MRPFLFTSLLLIAFHSNGQSVKADPAVSQISAKSITDVPLNAINNNVGITLDNVIKISIPIFNKSTVNALPQKSCIVKIGLGSKLVLDPQFNLSSLSTGTFFNWTTFAASGELQIIGDLKADLPPGFADSITINVKSIIQGNSTITTNFLVTNNNPDIVLSDENGANNNSSLGYTIAQGGPLPVNFTKVTAVNKGCAIAVDFYTEMEIDVSKYEIEISKDGVGFTKTGELAAANLPHYAFNFAITETNKANVLYVRIKSVDKDGSFKYSSTKTVKGFCINEMAVTVYPNPANAGSAITITARQGLFNGKYTITMNDLAGKQMLIKQLNLLDISQFKVETGNLSAGQYIINIFSQEEGRSTAIKWQKY